MPTRLLTALAQRAAIIAAVAGVAATNAAAAEVCRYDGTTDYAGRVAVIAAVSDEQGITQVDVRVNFDAASLVWGDLHYRIEEISRWRNGALERVAVNTRSFAGTRIVRQQWDDYQRGPAGLLAWRVQARTLAEFRRRHPGFLRHWDPAGFGAPWLDDYAAAVPERRPDLDVADGAAAALRSPLALAFYWVRWLPRAGGQMPVFLPGFKRDQRVDLSIAPAGSSATAPSSGEQRWRAELRHPALSAQPPSTATAAISRDGHLLQLAFGLHTMLGAASGRLQQRGCDGAAVPPPPGSQSISSHDQ